MGQVCPNRNSSDTDDECTDDLLRDADTSTQNEGSLTDQKPKHISKQTRQGRRIENETRNNNPCNQDNNHNGSKLRQGRFKMERNHCTEPSKQRMLRSDIHTEETEREDGFDGPARSAGKVPVILVDADESQGVGQTGNVPGSPTNTCAPMGSGGSHYKRMKEAEERYEYFWDSSDVFSQWYQTRNKSDQFSFDGTRWFNCAEQYMMFQKAGNVL